MEGSVARRLGPAGFDPLDLRGDFPVLQQEVHGRPLVYLDNGATAQKPRAVIDAVADFYRYDNANAHRGVHALAERATIAYEEARATVARHLNADDSREVVFVRGTTEAINLVAWSFLRPRLEAGDEILLTELEHHANIVPWQMLCAETGARLVVVPIDERGEVSLEAFTQRLSARTRLAAVAHVSNALGTVLPVAEMAAAARARGVPILVDGAQAVPHQAVDVQAIGCDFYAFSGHKVYGPTGIGALWGRLEHLEAMPPYQGGGDMIRRVSFAATTYADVPYKFEAGTQHIAGAVGLKAALDYIDGIGLAAIHNHGQTLLTCATAQLEAVPGLRVIGTARDKASLVSFVLEGAHPSDVGVLLDQEGVAVRAGHHCAMPVMDRFGIPGTVRASFGLYNTLQEVDVLVAALAKARRLLGL